MARPVVSAAAEELYEALDPAFTAPDEELDWPLLNFCAALTSGDLDRIHTYVTDQDDDTAGWTILLDPDNAPVEALPYLAQFAGVELRPDMDEAQRRAAIQSPEVFRRGTPASIIAVAKRRLTGSKTVLLTERYTGLAYRLLITTLPGETPEPELTESEIIAEQKPIGIALFFNSSPPWTWLELRTEEATWTAVAAEFDTWLEVRTHVP